MVFFSKMTKAVNREVSDPEELQKSFKGICVQSCLKSYIKLKETICNVKYE